MMALLAQVALVVAEQVAKVGLLSKQLQEELTLVEVEEVREQAIRLERLILREEQVVQVL